MPPLRKVTTDTIRQIMPGESMLFHRTGPATDRAATGLAHRLGYRLHTAAMLLVDPTTLETVRVLLVTRPE